MTFEAIPTAEGVTAVASYGPTATLFTLSRNHSIQQYDITPNQTPVLVAAVQHVPANTPPTPPTMLDEPHNRHGEPNTAVSTEAPVLPLYSDVESSADEGAAMSPLQKIAHEMDSLDAFESELRDQLMPLSPVSSRASSVSSRSSRGSKRGRKYLYDKPDSSRASTTSGFDGTEFSFGESVRKGHESISIRSVSQTSRSHQPRRTPNLRQELPRSPDEGDQVASMDLFPYIKSRLQEVAFRTPHYGTAARTPELLRREMLSVVFGWNDDIQDLIRDELARHPPGSASGVLLSKWLGDVGADSMTSMIGSESMTSSDWMLLALSSIGQESQKKVGEAFVQRLLEKGDIHPAVAILLGLGEFNDAIEVYVSQNSWMEAVLLTCLTCPSDWGRQSFLIRKWGEAAMQQGQPELAVRCFSCTSIETTEPWFSPRAQQDAAYAAQQQRLTAPLSAGVPQSPPNSPPSATPSDRIRAKNASLKLITTFGDKGAPLSVNQVAATPMDESALSPGGHTSWRQKPRAFRDPYSAHTATPGGFVNKKHLPSKGDIERAKKQAAELATPMTAARDFAPRPTGKSSHSRRASASTTSSVPEPTTALAPGGRDDGRLPSPGPDVLERLREHSDSNMSRSRKPSLASIHVVDTKYDASMSPAPSTGYDGSMYTTATERTRQDAPSPPLTGNKTRAINEYISSVEQARNAAREERAQSRAGSRAPSRTGRGEERRRDENRAGRAVSRGRGESSTRLIKPAKRSPSSPVPMSPEEVAQAKVEPATTDDESFYKIVSPVESHKSVRSTKFESKKKRSSPPDLRLGVDSQGGRGRSKSRPAEVTMRSPSLPPPKSPGMLPPEDLGDTNSDGHFRLRAMSASRRPGEDLQSRRSTSHSRRARSSSRRPAPREESIDGPRTSMADDNESESSLTMASEAGRRKPRGLSRKQLAAKELQERRMSLARRPSAPAIPLPGKNQPMSATRPGLSPRSHTELGDNPASFLPPVSRSQTVDPDAMSKYNKSKVAMPSIGLPATPRAMRHPRYMTSDPNERDAPPVPDIPGNIGDLGGSRTESSGSQTTGLNVESNISSSLQSAGSPPTETEDIGPLLPSTVFGQKGPQAPDRSMSAPPEKMGGNAYPVYNAGSPSSSNRGHMRKISPPEIQKIPEAPSRPFSIDEALYSSNDQDVIIIPEENDEPRQPVLPELQHLAGPPPPPPPPMFQPPDEGQRGSDVINIAIDDTPVVDVPETLPASTFPTTLPSTSYPMPMERAVTASPSMQRKARGSVSESFGSRFKGVTERMRSQSRGGTASHSISPPMAESYNTNRPYETVLPQMPAHNISYEGLNRAKSPYEQAMASGPQDQQTAPPPPPPPAPPRPGMDGKLQETAIPPQNLPRSQSTTGYRSQREIRANMPPESLQHGAYSGGFL